MSLDCSGKHLMPNSWSPAAVRDALKRAIKDVQTSPLPRALSVDKIFGPLVREIQSDQYRHMPQGLFPVRIPIGAVIDVLTISLKQVSSDSLVLDLSHNYTIFTRGDLAGVTEKELNMIALFEALQRDEICEDEVMSIAKFLTTPSPAAKGYFKIQYVVSISILEFLSIFPKSAKASAGGPQSFFQRTTTVSHIIHEFIDVSGRFPFDISQAVSL